MSTNGEWTKTDILRFLSDSVSVFYESAIAGTGDRAIRIVKMRRTRHERKAIGMTITSKGINIIAPISSVNVVESPVPINSEAAPITQTPVAVEVAAPADEKINVAPKGANPQVPMRLGMPKTSSLMEKGAAIVQKNP